MKKNYKIKIDKNIKKIPEHYRAEILAGYEDVLKEFPNAKGLVKKIIVEDGKNSRTLMYTRVIRNVYINRNIAFSVEELDRYFESLPEGYLPVNVSLRGVASHEIGHCLESYILYKRDSEHPGRYKEDAWSRSVVAQEIVEKAYLNIPDSIEEISIYSTRNDAEKLAEAVNDFLTNGYNAQQLSKEIVKIIKEELR